MGCDEKMIEVRSYSFPDVKSIIICGDIHGEFTALVHKLCVQYQMTDTLLLVAGDCGFGFEKEGYYENIFRRTSKRLSKANNYTLMIRGNHDDPAYFRQEHISHERFRTIPDYSVIQACGHNILCVGGAISIDRRYRMSAKNASNLYWSDEAPVYDEAKLKAIEGMFKIDTVVTHTAPSFCELISKNGLSAWAKDDPSLIQDCASERGSMDKLHSYIKASGHPLSHWYYGHFHQSWSSCIDGVLFSMLDILEFKELTPQKII